ncbi:MAG: organic hydroperoxide resistance protein [Rhodobacteraceae bacterium]|nr:organic hydroperoxide resistance protein [Paracoccaceae bacterium]MBR28289.1 organic hydroperoxide resistance protein [Paracoccaceae bacterium]
MKILYTAEAEAVGGREGTASTPDGALDLKLVKPVGMGGTGEGGTNPEQLFAAGYAACFVSTLDFLARAKKLEIGTPSAAARVSIGPNEDKPGYGLAVEMAVTIPGLEREAAQALLEEAHRNCPYSNATRGNVEVALTLA